MTGFEFAGKGERGIGGEGPYRRSVSYLWPNVSIYMPYMTTATRLNHHKRFFLDQLRTIIAMVLFRRGNTVAYSMSPSRRFSTTSFSSSISHF